MYVEKVYVYNMSIKLFPILFFIYKLYMGGSSSSVDDDFLKVKRNLKKLEKEYNDLKNKPTTNTNNSRTIDYKKLAQNFIEIDDYKQKLASALAEDPGEINENLVKSISLNNNAIQGIWQGLETNTDFATTLSAKLTDSTTSFPARLKGSQGEAGNLGSGANAMKSVLYDSKYTLWCADGSMCQTPPGIHKVSLGDWVISSDDDFLYFSKGGQQVAKIHSGGSFYGKDYAGWVQDWMVQNIIKPLQDKTQRFNDKGSFDNEFCIGKWRIRIDGNNWMQFDKLSGTHIKNGKMTLTNDGRLHIDGNFNAKNPGKWL